MKVFSICSLDQRIQSFSALSLDYFFPQLGIESGKFKYLAIDFSGA
jgi:hypothetical protein